MHSVYPRFFIVSIINIEKIIRGKTCGNFLNAPGYESGSGGSSGGSARVKNGKNVPGPLGWCGTKKRSLCRVCRGSSFRFRSAGGKENGGNSKAPCHAKSFSSLFRINGSGRKKHHALRRRNAARPTRPLPRSQTAPGRGTTAFPSPAA